MLKAESLHWLFAKLGHRMFLVTHRDHIETLYTFTFFKSEQFQILPFSLGLDSPELICLIDRENIPSCLVFCS